MERRLLVIAILCFLCELTIYFGDMFGISIPYWSEPKTLNHGIEIGVIDWTRHYVRRQNFGSNIWEDSESSDRLYSNDSILTLKGSSARLVLQNEITLELHENTLVTLDSSIQNEDQPFRLRFSRGDLRTQHTKRGLEMNAGEWTIQVAKGADVSLRESINGSFEVEVADGSVQLTHEKMSHPRTIQKDQLAQLSEKGEPEVLSTTEAMAWTNPLSMRVYSHEFPAQVNLKWTGNVQKIRVQKPDRQIEEVSVESKESTLEKTFLPGSYRLTLSDGVNLSKSMLLQVLRAPQMIYLFPLPRDRVKFNEPMAFSWLSEFNASSFRIEIATDPAFKNIVAQKISETTHVELDAPDHAELHWRIIGIDDEKFEVPARYSYPFFADPDPFSAPRIRSPSFAPSETPGASNRVLPMHSHRFRWMKLLNFFNESADATAFDASTPVIFNWEAIPGADHYIIEISETSQFEKPLIIAKVSTNFYAWSQFEKKIYYYRVAGGSNSGRQGLFSKPEPVDLRKWPPPKTTQQKPKKEPAIQTKNTTPAIPPTNALRPPPQRELSVSPPSPAALETLKVTSDSKVDTSVKSIIWWRAHYGTGQYTASSIANSRFQGLQPLGLGISFHFDEQNFGIDFQRLSLKVKDPASRPFQEPLTLDNIEVNYERLFFERAIWIGLGVNRWSTLARDGDENLKSKSQVGLGPSARISKNVGIGEVVLKLQLFSGGSNSLLPINLIWAQDLGASFSYQINVKHNEYFGTTKGQENQFGFSLGKVW